MKVLYPSFKQGQQLCEIPTQFYSIPSASHRCGTGVALAQSLLAWSGLQVPACGCKKSAKCRASPMV